MIVADTPAWLEYYRATGSEVHERMVQLIAKQGFLSVTEPALMEVVGRARDDQRELYLRRLLLRFPLLGFEAASDLHAVAPDLSAFAVFSGLLRGHGRCMFAAVPWRYQASVLARDMTLLRLAQIIGIGLE